MRSVALGTTCAVCAQCVRGGACPDLTAVGCLGSYAVMTQLRLKQRECCGHACRHCPWGHVNVAASLKATCAKPIVEDQDSLFCQPCSSGK